MSRPILLLDSGVGGLTILSAVRRALPQHSFVYLADWGYFPYGARSNEELVSRLQHIVGVCMLRYAPQLVVVACNTASTVTLPALRQAWPNVPFVGVVPAVKPAAQLTTSGSIAVLATAGTVSNGYTERLCKEFAPHCQVELIAAPTLVELAEDYMADATAPVDLSALAQAVRQRTPQADTCVLACTHFPILREPLMGALPQIKHWVDSSAAIARRVASLIPPADGVTGSDSRRGPVQLVCTAPPKLQSFNPHWQAELDLSQLKWQYLEELG